MDYTTLEEAIEQGDWPMEIDEEGVYEAFKRVPDGRKKRGIRYRVEDLLLLVVLGKLAGMKSPAAIAEWVRLRASQLKKLLAWSRPEFPCASTYSNVLQVLDSEALTQVLAEVLTRAEARRRCADEPSRLLSDLEGSRHQHLALDGKTLRGTLGHLGEDEPAMHQLGLYETQTGVLLKEKVVQEKENELSLMGDFLAPHLVKGRIITADALHTQHAFCQQVTRDGGEFVLIVKGNQPTLQEDLRLFFTDPPLDCRDWRTARSVDKGHGRLERRELIASTELNEWVAADDWAGVGQVFQLHRQIETPKKTREETVYGLTSLPPTRADAARLLQLVRDHWLIENRLHYRRDVTLGEDLCQVRKRQAPRVLAVLNSFVLALCDFWQVSNVPQRMRLYDARPWLAVCFLLGPLV
jgi:predicted transposase YbfD/YdcC